MSDRAIPRSYRTMEGFGVHTFRLVNATGIPHWSSSTGSRPRVSIRWSGKRPRSRPALIRTSTAATWPTTSRPATTRSGSSASKPSRHDDQTFEGIDLLDPTKLVPEELAPVQPIGRLTLNRNPSNYFAETEQVAFHTGSSGGGHRGLRRPTAASAELLLPGHPAFPVGRAELHPASDQSVARRGERQACATACIRPRCTRGSAPYQPSCSRWRVPPVPN